MAGAIPSGANKGNVIDNGILDLNGIARTVNGLWGSGTVTSSVAGAIAFTAGANNASSAFSGRIQNGSGTVSLTKTGNGLLDLSGGTNSYTGGTTIQGGVLRAVNGVSLPASGNVSILNVTATGQSARALELVGGSTFTRSFGTGSGQVQLSGTDKSPVGFSAYGTGGVALNFGGLGQTMTWGVTPGFFSSGGTNVANQYLLLGASTGNQPLTVMNPIDFGTFDGVGGVDRYIQVDGSNTARIWGGIDGGLTYTGTDFNVNSGHMLDKTGTGTLKLNVSPVTFKQLNVMAGQVIVSTSVLTSRRQERPPAVRW